MWPIAVVGSTNIFLIEIEHNNNNPGYHYILFLIQSLCMHPSTHLISSFNCEKVMLSFQYGLAILLSPPSFIQFSGL